MNYQPGDIGRIPCLVNNDVFIKQIAQENITISRADWESFETSWDFKRHPLAIAYGIQPKDRSVIPMWDMLSNTGVTIEAQYGYWKRHTDDQFAKLKSNEEELNRIFIEIYGLQDELTPEVEDKDVTVRKADLGRDIRSFISYAVGCMFGRYSLDEPGLVFAGGAFDMERYKTFTPEDDNILPIGSARAD
jgi:hypothetical protein